MYTHVYTCDIPTVQIFAVIYSPRESFTRLNFEHYLLYKNISRSKISQTTVPCSAAYSVYECSQLKINLE